MFRCLTTTIQPTKQRLKDKSKSSIQQNLDTKKTPNTNNSYFLTIVHRSRSVSNSKTLYPKNPPLNLNPSTCIKARRGKQFSVPHIAYRKTQSRAGSRKAITVCNMRSRDNGRPIILRLWTCHAIIARIAQISVRYRVCVLLTYLH